MNEVVTDQTERTTVRVLFPELSHFYWCRKHALREHPELSILLLPPSNGCIPKLIILHCMPTHNVSFVKRCSFYLQRAIHLATKNEINTWKFSRNDLLWLSTWIITTTVRRSTNLFRLLAMNHLQKLVYITGLTNRSYERQCGSMTWM